ncbi:putative membrane protein [Indibacter alkaliphilus LW1]|uniref:Membrane protein n=1 Tax=Indibacter alkaliphilus (strain CCUG 57479 / KCTC 22604 / LW1) TaxID=1189612 RepID=S2D818_INDAL|nr:MFS transporter [Indibacter alkaliphilus]EOZ95362.1 putative membrane protein [Indibacter alkaliphilus LW1]
MKRILPIIVLSQFLCTSLWFAGNAILPDLAAAMSLDEKFLGNLTSSVQFGFIAGTLIFAIFTIADKFPPSLVFFLSSLLAAAFNFTLGFEGLSSEFILLSRFATGFFLAGIYPVGMKIAADYFQKGLGKSLGLLVGALVLGTAFPHFIRSYIGEMDWTLVVQLTSGLAVFGGLLMLTLVPNGPFRSKGQAIDLILFFRVFKVKSFRQAAFGYFGHMWELYAFWAFVPVFLSAYGLKQDMNFDLSFWSFVIIAVGGLSCALGGMLSSAIRPLLISRTALSLSGICCFISPIFFLQPYPYILLIFMLFWGMVVTADSPMFSTLVAQNVPQHQKGTALTIVNCVGFGITIVSIQLLNFIHAFVQTEFLLIILGLGPLFGTFFIFKKELSIRN